MLARSKEATTARNDRNKRASKKRNETMQRSRRSPRVARVARRFFSIEEVQRILAAAPEPYQTFYWIAVETGMRAGELCGLRACDFDLERGLVGVRQSVWRGKVQSPKSENAMRCFALSPRLQLHMSDFLKRWKPNEGGFVFATRNGTPMGRESVS
jgi:integrase